MQRVINFRAWTGKKMMYQEKQYLGSFLRRVVAQIMIDHEDEPREHESYLPRGTTIDDYLLQFTGLFDRLKVGIYEGDIVKVEDSASGVIEYLGACFIIREGDSRMSLNDIAPEYAEVIGNIYENPELKPK